ncbi:acyl-homoserine-lactone synthase [Nonomuraea monospora]|uniref:acyl-homoserine-lactone synthase n=1 Tax=Nonomuraea monospora TaxID=568818 RepID=UPI0031D36BFA
MNEATGKKCTRAVAVGRAAELPEWLLDGMFRLRHEVFYERLRWDVASLHGRERDFYDDCQPVYVIAYEDGCRQVTGCCRLLPTHGPYMLRDVFSAALRGGQAPRDPAVWELSRLATRPGRSRALAAGFGSLARALLWEAFRWVDRHGDTIVAVSSVAVERSVHAMGVPTTRLGDGRATRVGKVLCSAYTTTTRDFLENAPPPAEEDDRCP